ncbi:elongation factor Ts, mitochondrial [Dryobates pubescens]|uniref:elongation factor Ts, mitochondrial n=1 Tax=Dryobates pubescens TaxID=118200 RepID=UPI0023B90474|nr:elongation factor Ts, mitochondrial [Dryobates pubescens]
MARLRRARGDVTQELANGTPRPGQARAFRRAVRGSLVTSSACAAGRDAAGGARRPARGGEGEAPGRYLLRDDPHRRAPSPGRSTPPRPPRRYREPSRHSPAWDICSGTALAGIASPGAPSRPGHSAWDTLPGASPTGTQSPGTPLPRDTLSPWDTPGASPTGTPLPRDTPSPRDPHPQDMSTQDTSRDPDSSTPPHPPRLRRAPPIPRVRFFRAAPALLAADKESLLQLRRRTGLPFLKCQEALRRCGGDLPQAEAWLQEEAQRQGWSKASALGARPAREGLLGLLREGSAAAMVEVNCETDFVARTAEFRRLVELAALGAMAHCRGAALPPAPCTTHLLRAEELAELRAGPGGQLLSDHIAMATGKLGEKLALRRAAWLRVPTPGGFVATYAHGGGGGAGPGGAVAMGTYGALVGCGGAGAGPPRAELEELGRKVAQHVVGMAPRSLGTPQDLPRGEEESRLLAQSFLLQPQLTVGQLLRGGGLLVSGFLRFQCGEETPAAPPDTAPAPPA